MNANHNMKKCPYTQPEIQKIELDNDISLQLQSSPPIGPNELSQSLYNSDFFNTNPIKNPG